MRRILILFAHPALQKSRINSRLSTGLPDIEGVTFHDLYEEYPEFDIDVEREKKLAEQHDVIAFYHPLYWYSTPAIFKEWQDLVLEHGWAYGSEGNALKNKVFFNIITAGGRKEAYSVDGYNAHTLRQLLAPLEQTVSLCKMIFLPPFVLYGTHSIQGDDIAGHRSQLLDFLQMLRQDSIDIDRARQLNNLNDYSQPS